MSSYLPGFNRIQNCFSGLKAFIQRLYRIKRTHFRDYRFSFRDELNLHKPLAKSISYTHSSLFTNHSLYTYVTGPFLVLAGPFALIPNNRSSHQHHHHTYWPLLTLIYYMMISLCARHGDVYPDITAGFTIIQVLTRDIDTPSPLLLQLLQIRLLHRP